MTEMVNATYLRRVAKMNKTLLIFFLDAVRYDYVNPLDAPFLYKMATTGISGPLQTILGFDGIAPTIFTGTYPDVHGVWTQYILAEENGPFEWIRPLSSILDKADKAINRCDPLWKAFRFAILEASLIKSRRSFYPGINRVPISLLSRFDFSMKRNLYEKNAFGPIPTLFDLLEKNEIDFSVIDHSVFRSDQYVVEKILQAKYPCSVIYARLMDLDEITHTYGIFSRERKNALRILDTSLYTIVSHFERRGVDPYVILFADHGMVDVTRYVNVMDPIRRHGLIEGKDFIVFLDSTMTRFWGEDSVLIEISNILTGLGMGRILTDSDIQKYHAPKLGGRYGNLIYLADPGVVILPNYYQGDGGVSAMHGYDPTISEMNTILIIYHKKITPRKVYDTKLIDILPTILDILGISKPNHCLGVSKLQE